MRYAMCGSASAALCGTLDSLVLKAERAEVDSSVQSEVLAYALDQTCYWTIVGTKLAFGEGAAVRIKLEQLNNTRGFILQGESMEDAALLEEHLQEGQEYRVPLSDLNTYFVVAPFNLTEGQVKFNYNIDPDAGLGDFRDLKNGKSSNDNSTPTIILFIGLVVIGFSVFFMFYFKKFKARLSARFLKRASSKGSKGSKGSNESPDLSNEKF